MYIIPLIAVAGLKRDICKDDPVDCVQMLAFLLCCPHRTFYPFLSSDLVFTG